MRWQRRLKSHFLTKRFCNPAKAQSMFSASIFAGRRISLQFRTEELRRNKKILLCGAQRFGEPQHNMTGDLSGYNQFARVARRTKRQREKANSPVVHVVQLESPLERLSDCRTVPYLRFFLVRNEEVAGSIPVSSTKVLCFPKAGRSIRLSAFTRPEELVFILANSARRGIRLPPRARPNLVRAQATSIIITQKPQIACV
jgi:hypothetical protein